MTRVVTLLGYVVVVLVALGLELRGRRRGGGRFVDTVTLALRWPPARILVLAAWLWLGWHLFVRVDWK